MSDDTGRRSSKWEPHGSGIPRRHILSAGAMAYFAMGADGSRSQPLSDTKATILVPPMYRERQRVFDEAQKLDLLGPAPSAVLGGPQDVTPLDLAEIVSEALARGAADDKAQRLAALAGSLLSQEARDERDAAQQALDEPAAAAAFFSFDAVKVDYKAKFQAASIRAPRAGEVDFRPHILRAARIITTPSARAQYNRVATSTGVPWYVIGAIHYREASINFMPPRCLAWVVTTTPCLSSLCHLPADVSWFG
jgi:hypothetical protein